MAESNREFHIRGTRQEEETPTGAYTEELWLEKHIEIRRLISEFTEKNQWQFASSFSDFVYPTDEFYLWQAEADDQPIEYRWNRDYIIRVGYWFYGLREDERGQIASRFNYIKGFYGEASKDVVIGCELATVLTIYAAYAESMGQAQFDAVVGQFIYGQLGGPMNVLLREDNNVPAWDWIPGEWGYIINQNMFYTPGQEGENIIYTGASKGFWGFPGGYKSSLGQWINEVTSWGRNQYRSGNTQATVKPTRRRPILGLEK